MAETSRAISGRLTFAEIPAGPGRQAPQHISFGHETSVAARGVLGERPGLAVQGWHRPAEAQQAQIVSTSLKASDQPSGTWSDGSSDETTRCARWTHRRDYRSVDDDDCDLRDYDARDYDAKLYVGGLEIASMEEKVPPELLSVFTDEMHRTRIATAAAHPPQIEPGDTVTEFAAPGPVIAARLDILGFTPVYVQETIDGVLDEARGLADLVHEYLPDASKPGHNTEPARLAEYAAADWIAELRASTRGEEPQDRSDPRGTTRLMALIKNADRRVALRAALLARPDAEVRLDVTHLYDMGALETTDEL